MSKRWKIAAINFDHMHMGDLLRMATNHPEVDIVGVSDLEPPRAAPVLERLGIDQALLTEDYRACLERSKPDLVILCPATSHHAEWVEKVAPYCAHVFVEKPFASSLAEAHRMINALEATGKQLVINWPLRWYPSHMTAKRLLDEGLIGDLKEVHFYDGNRGPLRHIMDKIEMPETDPVTKNKTWWYQKSHGGGSLQDYLGYGVTLGTWFHGGREPIEVTAVVDIPPGLEVDEHSLVVCRYDTGLSKYETRWGTFSDPWIHQPQPKCGFVLVGSRGTIASYDLEPSIRVQTLDRPEGFEIASDTPQHPFRNPIEYVLDCLAKDEKVSGPLSVEISLVGQKIVDSAVLSATEKRTVPLITHPQS
ncbi:MAG: Gfo/Idh/MocA family oxidoreductase [Fimbriimonadaceae bacterium]|jgi:glucose-fructose oxidoreductase|nr:Gfo/Idh/MocA family oxidoreductase [Fimbriimonadaceae bacterium]